MKALKYTEIAEAKKQLKAPTRQISLVLDRLTSIENIAHIFRLADALRIRQILLYNMPDSLINQKTDRLSRSTIKNTPYYILESIEAIKKQINGSQIIALEWTERSTSLFEFEDYPDHVALIIGSESHGVSTELLALANRSIHLPMYGRNSSINAAMAASIASYHLSRL